MSSIFISAAQRHFFLILAYLITMITGDGSADPPLQIHLFYGNA